MAPDWLNVVDLFWGRGATVLPSSGATKCGTPQVKIRASAKLLRVLLGMAELRDIFLGIWTQGRVLWDTGRKESKDHG